MKYKPLKITFHDKTEAPGALDSNKIVRDKNGDYIPKEYILSYVALTSTEFNTLPEATRAAELRMMK